MYIPPHYKNDDQQQVKAFLKENSFGILINTINAKPWGTHIPLELGFNNKNNEVLVGHIAKANLQSKCLKDGDDVLCIFNGPHSYISSSWYKQEEVPTWNYIAVHVYGKIKLQSDEALLKSLHALVNKYEKDAEHPISLNNMSPKTMRQVNGIIGFEIEIEEMHAVHKLSQGREQDHTKIIAELDKRDEGAKAIAAKMKKKY